MTHQENPSRPRAAEPETEAEALPEPAASSKLAHVVYTICRNHPETKVKFLSSQGAILALDAKETVFLLTWDETLADILSEKFESLMKPSAEGLKVVGLIGGSETARQILEKSSSIMPRLTVGQIHIDDQDAIWTRNAGLVEQALIDLAVAPPPSETAWATMLDQSTAKMAANKQQADEAMAVFTWRNARQPVVTIALAILILAVFGLEYAFGGTESPTVLLRMGALDPDRVFAGEIWRLFSCTFLHSGPSHLLFNIFVLLVLGSSLERLLGSWRLLLLYGLACLGASLTSMLFLEGFSVGASGALWGLLGAEAVLAWRSQGLLPRAMIKGARKAATINLGINLLNSFRPHVDMWAHFGGGAVGAALLLSGVLTRNLPRLGELERQERLSDPKAVAIPVSPRLRWGASLTGLILLLSLVFGLGVGRPWMLQQPVELVQTPLPELGISLALPAGLQQIPEPETTLSVRVGDLALDLGSAIITLYPGDFTDDAIIERELSTLVEQLKELPSGSRLIAGPQETPIAGARGVNVRYAYESGLEEELAFVFLEDALVKADTLRWPSFHKAVPLGYAAKILDRLERLPEASGPNL